MGGGKRYIERGEGEDQGKNPVWLSVSKTKGNLITKRYYLPSKFRLTSNYYKTSIWLKNKF